MHFKLLRYFSIASAVAILALAAALFFFYGRSAETQLVSTVEHDNIVLATAMANEIVGAFPEHFQVPHTPDTLNKDHHRRHIPEIDRKLQQLVEDSPILAVNVFWNDLTVYASRKELIGTIKKSPGFLIARKGGKAVSKLVFKGIFNAFEGEVADRDIVETYVPVRLPDHLAQSGATLILEIYTDVSAVAAEIKTTKQQLLAGLVLGFGALYVMLFLIVRHADTIISRHDKRFTDFAEAASDWFWEMDENLRFTYHSPKYFRITGFRPEDKIGTTRTRYVDPSKLSKGAEKWDAHMADLQARRPFKNFEYTFTVKDGSLLYVSTSGTPLFDDNGAFRGYRGTGTDISKRKRAEEASRQLAAAIEPLDECVAIYDSDDRLVFWNEAYRKHHEGELEKLIKPGLRLEDLVRARAYSGEAPEAVGREEAYVAERMERHRNPGEQFETPRKDRWFIYRESPTPEGGTIIVISDITERKRSEELLTDAVESIPEGFALYDADDRLVLFNKNFLKGRPGLEKILKVGMTFEEQSRLREKLGLRAKHKGTSSIPLKERIERHLNPTGPYEARLPDGRTLQINEFKTHAGGTAIIRTDITDRVQADEGRRLALVEAEQANQAKSEFLASISHDLRTPLNAILGFSDILSQQYFGPPGAGKYREYANDIHTSGEHLLELVNEILDLSTIEAGKQTVVIEKLSTLEIVRECMRLVEDKARSNGIELITELPKDFPPLYADRRASKQILLNLLSNAVKFTPQGGKITVSAKASKKNTTLKIADTGKGIPAEKLPKLTNPFTKGGLDPYLAEEGWGLGLAITKALVDLHDGKLDIKSKIGKGTTVTVTLPNGAP